jgi:DNA polymerase III sliding clamp (beta) subunit (PCNA family)
MKIEIAAEHLEEIFGTCKSYVGKGANRPALGMVRLACDGKKCIACATDGYKLVLTEAPCLEGSDAGEMLVPIVKIPKRARRAGYFPVAISDGGGEVSFSFWGEGKVAEKARAGEHIENPEKFFNAGEPVFRIAFDPALLRDALAGFGNAGVKLEFFGANKGCHIEPVGTPGKKAIVLPQKL